MESFPEFLLMESVCNAWGSLKIFHWAASKVMVNIVVEIKVLCIENFWKGCVPGGSLCLLAWSRATGRALDLAWEPARQCVWAFCSRVGLQDSGSAQAVDFFLKLRGFPFFKDSFSTAELRTKRDKLIVSSTTCQQSAQSGVLFILPKWFQLQHAQCFLYRFYVIRLWCLLVLHTEIGLGLNTKLQNKKKILWVGQFNVVAWKCQFMTTGRFLY